MQDGCAAFSVPCVKAALNAVASNGVLSVRPLLSVRAPLGSSCGCSLWTRLAGAGSAGQRYPLARLCWPPADAASARLLAIEPLEACVGPTGKTHVAAEQLHSEEGLGLLGKLWGRRDGMSRQRSVRVRGGGRSGRQQTGVRGTPPGRRRWKGRRVREQPVRSVAEGARSPAAQLGASGPHAGCAAPPGGVPHRRPLPGGCVKASAEPRAVGVGAPRCHGGVQAPSCPRRCLWNISRGCCSTGHRLTKVVSPCPQLLGSGHALLLGSGPPGNASLGFCWNFLVPQRQTGAASLLCIFLGREAGSPSCRRDQESSGERGRPAWEAAFALPPGTCSALGWGFGILGQDCEISAWATTLHHLTVLWALRRA